MYHFYLGKMLCPVAPSKLQLKIKNNNKTITLINEGDVTILKKAGLTEISFDLLLPNVQYPFATYKSGFQNAKFFLNELAKLKVERKPFQFIVSRILPNGTMLFDNDMKVSLESYDVKEDAKQGFDVEVSVKLKQYKDYGTKTLTISSNNQNTCNVETKRSDETSPAPSTNKTHTVQKGDCLWNIAKKYYGNGSKYPKIYEANKTLMDKRNSKSGNSKYTIYPGQVLTIPALK